MEHIESTDVLLPSMSIGSEMGQVKIDIDAVENRITINATPEMVINIGHSTSSSSFYIGDEAIASSSESLPQLVDSTIVEQDKIEMKKQGKSRFGSSIIINLLSGAKEMMLTRYSSPFKSKSAGYKGQDSRCVLHSPSEARMLFNIDGHDAEKVSGKSRRFISPFISEMLFSFLGIILSSLGNFAAGLILDHQQQFEVYKNIPELIYLVPTLLGLKGNLEMTMVARLCTMANMGQFKSVRFVAQVMINNLCMVNSQAILVSFLASFVTFLMAFGRRMFEAPVESIVESIVANATQSGPLVVTDNSPVQSIDFVVKMLVVLTTTFWTANLACIISTIFLILLIAIVSRLGADPDNFATALAASIGDMITSYLLGVVGQWVLSNTVTYPGVLIDSVTGLVNEPLYSYHLIVCSIVFFVIFFFVTGYVALQDPASRRVLTGVSAWAPIILSMLLSFVSGIILRSGVALYRYIALFQPLLNGVGGNLAAIATSRLSTLLHKTESSSGREIRQKRPPFLVMLKEACHSFLDIKYQENIASIFFVFLSIFVHCWFGYLLPMSKDREAEESITLLFYIFYIVAATVQVIILLFMVRFVVSIIWWMGKDPDTSAIPIITATGDILGSIFLLAVFALLNYLHDSSAAAAALTTDDSPVNLTNLLEATYLFVSPTGTNTPTIPTTLAPSTGFFFADF